MTRAVVGAHHSNQRSDWDYVHLALWNRRRFLNLFCNLQFDSIGIFENLGNFFEKTNYRALGLFLYRNTSNSSEK